MTYEADESRRSWKKCDCPIYASGTLGRHFKRKNTECRKWDSAKALVAPWEAIQAWETVAPVAVFPETQPEPEVPRGITITEATSAFLLKCENRGIALPTLRKYRTFVKQLRAYCDASGYVLLAQLTVLDMDRFYAAWKDEKRAKAKKLERLKALSDSA